MTLRLHRTSAAQLQVIIIIMNFFLVSSVFSAGHCVEIKSTHWLIFEETGLPGYPSKNLPEQSTDELHPRVTPILGIEPGRVTLVGGEWSHHEAISALLFESGFFAIHRLQ